MRRTWNSRRLICLLLLSGCTLGHKSEPSEIVTHEKVLQIEQRTQTDPNLKRYALTQADLKILASRGLLQGTNETALKKITKN